MAPPAPQLRRCEACKANPDSDHRAPAARGKGGGGLKSMRTGTAATAPPPPLPPAACLYAPCSSTVATGTLLLYPPPLLAAASPARARHTRSTDGVPLHAKGSQHSTRPRQTKKGSLAGGNWAVAGGPKVWLQLARSNCTRPLCPSVRTRPLAAEYSALVNHQLHGPAGRPTVDKRREGGLGQRPQRWACWPTGLCSRRPSGPATAGLPVKAAACQAPPPHRTTHAAAPAFRGPVERAEGGVNLSGCGTPLHLSPRPPERGGAGMHDGRGWAMIWPAGAGAQGPSCHG